MSHLQKYPVKKWVKFGSFVTSINELVITVNELKLAKAKCRSCKQDLDDNNTDVVIYIFYYRKGCHRLPSVH